MSVPPRAPLVVGNWKMSLDLVQAQALAESLRALDDLPPDVEAAVAPSFPALERVAKTLSGSGIALAAQDVYVAASGAFTGEVSAAMLRDLGVRFTIVGHSERRRLRGELEADFTKKMTRLIESAIVPLYCVGETLAEREAGETERVLARQIRALDAFPSPPVGLVLAYEPVWAIGTGRPATAGMAQAAHAELRRLLAALWGEEAARRIRILYGGSVTPENAEALFSEEDVDGGLVGGASLTAAGFAALLRAAALAGD